MTYEEILSHFKVKHQNGDKAQCICPAHDDKEASLSISKLKAGKTGVHCHAGCSIDDVLRAAGLSIQDLFDDDGQKQSRNDQKKTWKDYVESRAEKKLEGAYHYRKLNGEYAFTRLRFPGKEFVYGIIANGRFTYGLNGVSRKNIPAIYSTKTIKEIQDAIEAGETVYYTEGEKDANTMARKGFVAVTCGGSSDWVPECSELFTGADAVVLADNDTPGKKLADEVKASLAPVAKSVKVIVPVPEIEKADISDYFTNHTVDDFKALIASSGNETKSSGLSFTNGADLAVADLPPIRWLVDGFLPAGLVKLCGEPKTYKSYMALDLCLSVCLGRKFMGKQTQSGGAVYFDLEATPRRAKTRMLQVLGDDPAPTNYYTHCGMEDIRLIGDGFEDDLNAFLDTHTDVVLVVVDVFIKIRPSRKANEVLKNEYLDTQELWKIANTRNICIVLVEHTNKQTSAKPFDRIAGANTSRGSTDVNMVVIREPDSETEAVLSIEGREVITDRYVIRWDADSFRWNLDGRAEDLKRQKRLEKEYHEYFSHDAVKAIRAGIKSEGFWSGYMQELVDESESDMTAKKMGAKIKSWVDNKFFEREDVTVTKRFLDGKWKYTFKSMSQSPKTVQISLDDSITL